LSNQLRYRELSKQYDLPLFFQPWWLDMVSNNWDAAILEENGTLKAVWPYTIEKKISITIIRNPLMTPYLGPYFLSNDINSETLEKLWQQLPKWDVCSVECTPGLRNTSFFSQKEFDHSERITYLFPLQGEEEELFRRMNENPRAAIRKAERELKVIDGASHIQQFYRLHKHTIESKGKKYPYSEQFFTKLINISLEHKAGTLLAAENADKKISAMLFAGYDAQRMYLLLTATNPEAMHNGAVSLLIWKAMLHGKKLGLELFDFEGSMDPGVEAFFRRFGGDKTMRYTYSANRSLLWKLKKALLG
jgi:hypothetical protein